jgi:hypothetical protein
MAEEIQEFVLVPCDAADAPPAAMPPAEMSSESASGVPALTAAFGRGY